MDAMAWHNSLGDTTVEVEAYAPQIKFNIDTQHDAIIWKEIFRFQTINLGYL